MIISVACIVQYGVKPILIACIGGAGTRCPAIKRQEICCKFANCTSNWKEIPM